MHNPYVEDLVDSANFLLHRYPAGVTEPQLIRELLNESTPGLTLGERAVLYPSFAKTLMPALIRTARSRGVFGYADGIWQLVSRSEALTTARAENRQTPEEIDALFRWDPAA